jgi:hypothetical protein
LPRQYRTATDFRQALEANLKKQEGDLQRLRRHVAFERFLARLFHQPDMPWMLKGGYAMELRLEQRARSTKDLDLTIPDTDQLQLMVNADPKATKQDIVFEAFQQIAEIDLNDFFEFQIRKLPEDVKEAPEGGIRCSIICLLGKEFSKFRLDVGFGDVITGPADWVKGSRILEFAEIPAVNVSLIPITQQFAEKVHAYTHPWEDRPNMRDKDLVDLVLIIETFPPNPDELRKALLTVFKHRKKQELPAEFPEPPEEWAVPYEDKADELGLNARTLDEAHQLISKYWDEWHLGRQD